MRCISLAGLCICLVLCACGRSIPTSYYILESASSAMESGDMPKTSLRVAPVSVPAYLDRTGLVRHGDGAGNLTVEENHQWAEPLAEGIRRVLQEELAAPLRSRGVHVLANADDSDSDTILHVHVERLDAAKPGMVRMVAQWRCDKNGRSVAQGVFAENCVVSGSGMTPLVEAQGTLVRQLAAWILDHLPRLAEGKRS